MFDVCLVGGNVDVKVVCLTPCMRAGNAGWLPDVGISADLLRPGSPLDKFLVDKSE